MVTMDKNIRATQYPNTKEQREFLDKQSRIVVSLVNIFKLSSRNRLNIPVGLPPADLDLCQ